MRAPSITPTGVERRLARDELIVSKTDAKGVLTYVNDVFCTMAAAREEDLLGRPHNVIRHPEMPRAVFKLMWETIVARREIFAYVVNLGLDGSHYWVFAHVTPSGTGGATVSGYHSNRRAPAPEAVEAVRPLYRRLCEVESTHASSRDALEASSAELAASLAERGTTYDELVWAITP